ncbi:MAG: SufB/SufD family protein [Methanomassiliicoccales archaeon]
MQASKELTRRAKEALKKESAYGEDIDLGEYEDAPKDTEERGSLEEFEEDVQESMFNVGVVPDAKDRSGSFLMMDNAAVHTSLVGPGVEMKSLSKALEEHEWLDEYSWNLVPVDKDKYTAKSYLEGADGYFIRALPGQKVKLPVQTCLMMKKDNASQYVHNVIIVEEGASLDVVTGCTTGKGIERAIHLGISEIYVKEGGSLTFSMIHNWAEQIGVRPRTVIKVEKDGSFVNNYVVLRPVRSVQSYPTARLDGEGASARFNSVAISHPGSSLDLGSRVVLNAPDTGAEIISRTITTGGKVVARGHLVGNARDIKAHLECKGLILHEDGTQVAIPELEANVPEVDMTHEAAVGKIAQDQVEYLMSRGLSEEQAVGMIVRGFLEGGIKGLPQNLKDEIEKAVSQADIGAM